ncbi:MAG: hypothetical protein V3V67_04305 [Myxococcota bacterium]
MATSFVTAISGPSGCGKSALVMAVADRLEGAATLHFDDFADDPPDIEEWGSLSVVDFGRWETPDLASALERLKGGRPVTPPSATESVAAGRQALAVQPHRYIVLEEPFGRLRPDTARSIDYAVCIDLPLHLALARRFRRQLEVIQRRASENSDAEKRARVLSTGAEFFETYLGIYLRWGHHFYAEQLRQLGETSDLLVDGRRPVAELADEVAAAVRRAAEAG